MEQQFLQLPIQHGSPEVIINVGKISKIEMTYFKKNSGFGGFHPPIDRREGMKDPDALKRYVIHVGPNGYQIEPKPGSRLWQFLEDFYKNSIKDE